MVVKSKLQSLDSSANENICPNYFYNLKIYTHVKKRRKRFIFLLSLVTLFEIIENIRTKQSCIIETMFDDILQGWGNDSKLIGSKKEAETF